MFIYFERICISIDIGKDPFQYLWYIEDNKIFTKVLNFLKFLINKSYNHNSKYYYDCIC